MATIRQTPAVTTALPFAACWPFTHRILYLEHEPFLPQCLEEIPSSSAGSGEPEPQVFWNVEQTCPDGYSGDPVPAGSVSAESQGAADALAAAMLECHNNAKWWSVSEDYVVSGSEALAVTGWNTLSEDYEVSGNEEYSSSGWETFNET